MALIVPLTVEVMPVVLIPAVLVGLVLVSAC